MKTENLNLYRDPKQPEDVNVLKNLIKTHITDKPNGKVAFGWDMQQCGYSLWYRCSGYYDGPDGTVAVSIRYTYR